MDITGTAQVTVLGRRRAILLFPLLSYATARGHNLIHSSLTPHPFSAKSFAMFGWLAQSSWRHVVSTRRGIMA